VSLLFRVGVDIVGRSVSDLGRIGSAYGEKT